MRTPPVDVLICSIGWRAPACLSLLESLKKQTLPPRRVVIRADSWSDTNTTAARDLGAEVREVEPGCGQQPRWLDVEAWPDPEVIVLVLDDDVRPPATALEECAHVIGYDKKKLCAPAGVSTDQYAVIQLAWGNALALYPAALAGLNDSDLSPLLTKGMSDELVICAWLRRGDCVIHRHPASPWPTHESATDPRAFSLNITHLHRKQALLEKLASLDLRPDAEMLWRSMRSTVQHQVFVAEKTGASSRS